MNAATRPFIDTRANRVDHPRFDRSQNYPADGSVVIVAPMKWDEVPSGGSRWR